MRKDTPASNLRREGKPATFSNVDKGQTFELNGNLWIKRSSRTATGLWPAILPKWAYVGGNEKVHTEAQTY